MWHGFIDREGKALKAEVAAFNASHDNIHVTLQNYGNADFALRKVLTGIRAGSYPDIAYLYGSYAASLADAPRSWT